MTGSLHPDLACWLDIATRNLPPEAAALIRAEITAHYEDALEDYMAEGSDLEMAHEQVMEDLGAATPVASGFSDVHRGQRHYMAAAVASLLVFVVIFFLPMALMLVGVEIPPVLALVVLIRLALMVYVVRVLSWLVSWRLDLPGTRRMFGLMAGGLTFEAIGMATSLLLTGTDAMVDISRPVGAVGTLAEVALLVLTQGGRLMAAAGVLALGLALIRSRAGLHGLSKPLGGLAVFMGGGLVLACLLPYLHDTAASIAVVSVIVGHTLLWPFLTLVFFRAAYRSPVRPASAV